VVTTTGPRSGVCIINIMLNFENCADDKQTDFIVQGLHAAATHCTCQTHSDSGVAPCPYVEAFKDFIRRNTTTAASQISRETSQAVLKHIEHVWSVLNGSRTVLVTEAPRTHCLTCNGSNTGCRSVHQLCEHRVCVQDKADLPAEEDWKTTNKQTTLLPLQYDKVKQDFVPTRTETHLSRYRTPTLYIPVDPDRHRSGPGGSMFAFGQHTSFASWIAANHQGEVPYVCGEAFPCHPDFAYRCRCHLASRYGFAVIDIDVCRTCNKALSGVDET